MKAIIPVAGYATRLWPLTKNQPKALLPIGGRPILESIIENIIADGRVDEVVLVSNTKFYHNFVDWADQSSLADRVKLTVLDDGTSSNEDRLGPIGDMDFALKNVPGLAEADILITAGDSLFEEDFTGMFDLYDVANEVVMGSYQLGSTEAAKRFGVVLADERNKLLDFEEKPAEPKSTLASIMFYIIPQRFVHLISQCLADGPKDRELNSGELIEYLMKHTDVYTHTFTGAWFDIGTHEQLAEANEAFGGE